MQQLSQVSRVDVGFDPEFENRWWAIIRIIWFMLAVFTAAGIAGIFGRGAFSPAVTRSGDLTVHYDKRLRFKTPSQIRIEATAQRPILQLEVGRPCFQATQVTRIAPPPESSQPLHPGAVYRFPEPASGPAAVMLSLEPGAFGPTTFHITVGAGGSVEIHQFIFPYSVRWEPFCARSSFTGFCS